jgi:hypothetical protein
MTNLWGQDKKVFDKKEKPKNEIYSLIYFYLRLKDQEPNPIIAKRFLRDASDLLKLGTLDEVKERIMEIKKRFELKGLEWSLSAVIRTWGKSFKSKNELAEELYWKQFQAESDAFDKKYGIGKFEKPLK